MRPQLESLPGASDSLTVAQLADYVQRQLQNIAASVTGLYEGEGEVSNRAPTKPREGLYAWADGANWNPAGVGKGPVVYDGSAYRALYSTPGSILAALLTVDGPGSLLDADFLDSQSGAFYRDAGNLNAGTLPDARFPATLPAVNGSLLTNLNASNLASGTVPAGRMPALTGDVTTTAGSVATTIGANKVTLAMLATMATGNVLGRNTPGTGNVETLAFAEANTASTLVKRDANGRLAAVGLFFPATQSASTDVNCLDDYEEGTFTPTITANSGTFTTVSASGEYTKIGNRVLWFVKVTITTNGTAASYVICSGFPFTFGQDNTGYGRETAALGWLLQSAGNATGSAMNFLKWDNTYPTDGSNGRTLQMNGHFRV